MFFTWSVIFTTPADASGSALEGAGRFPQPAAQNTRDTANAPAIPVRMEHPSGKPLARYAAEGAPY